MPGTDDRGFRVKLKGSELLMASSLACMRRVNGLMRGRKPRNRAEVNRGWEYDCVGALGECVVAKAFNIYWNGSIGDLSVPDVGPLEVRATSYLAGYGGRGLPFMGINKDDKDDHPYFQVVGPGPEFWITGWMMGVDCKRAEWWKEVGGNGRFCYQVPGESLHPLKDFPLLPTHLRT